MEQQSNLNAHGKKNNNNSGPKMNNSRNEQKPTGGVENKEVRATGATDNREQSGQQQKVQPLRKPEAKSGAQREESGASEKTPFAKLGEFASGSMKEVTASVKEAVAPSLESLEKVGLSAESARDLSFQLDRALLASRGLVAREKTVVYLGKVGSEITEHLADYLVEWAQKNQARLHVKVNGVSTRTPYFAGAGAVVGGIVGHRFGGKAGAALGVLFGATLGSLASCVDVHFHTDAAGNTSVAVA